MASFPRPFLFLVLAACSRGEDCKTRQDEAYKAWNEVADYYQRVADMKKKERDEAVAEARLHTEERERHERAAATARFRQTHGLEDAETGAKHIDPEEAKRQARLGRAANARANATADDEELAVAELVAVDEIIAELEKKSQSASRIRDLTRGDAALAWAAASAGVGLTGTELVGLAAEASRLSHEACAP